MEPEQDQAVIDWDRPIWRVRDGARAVRVEKSCGGRQVFFDTDDPYDGAWHYSNEGVFEWPGPLDDDVQMVEDHRLTNDITETATWEPPESSVFTGPGLYRARNGITVTIEGHNGEDTLPWQGYADGLGQNWWSDAGTFWSSGAEDEWDLVERLTEGPKVEQHGTLHVTFGPAGRFESSQNPERVTQPEPTRGTWYLSDEELSTPEDTEEPEFLSLDWLLNLHEETCRAGRDTMYRKNNDYTCGSANVFANFEGSSIFGIHPVMGIMLRLTDKLKRIETFVTKGELLVAGEGVDDAIEDAVNYLILIKGLIRKEQANSSS